MESETISFAATPDANHVVHLLETLYNSKDPMEQDKANRRLMELQSSDDIWQVCWPLLDPEKFQAVEVHFFAANTLVSKINQSWSQQKQEWLENHLRPKLFEALVSYSSSPSCGKLVVERLSLALATFALHSIPTFWSDAIENILQTFTPQNLPSSIPPQRICDILLKILMYIPEEYSVLMPQQDHRAKLNHQMTKSGPIVFKFLHTLLRTDDGTLTSECKGSVLKCITSWTMHSQTSLLETDDGKPLLDLLYGLILDEELCSLACATIAATFNNQKAENYRNAIIDFIPKIAKLRYALEKYKSNDEVECVIKIYSLVINFSENHSRLFLKIVLMDGIQLNSETAALVKQDIFTIITMILDCTKAPGIYGMDEKYSDLSFAFWFSFFENFYYYSDAYNDLICETFDPLVDSLMQALISKSQYPPLTTYYQLWNDDQRESYRCFRQDLGDNMSLIALFPRAKERILARLHSQMEQDLACMLRGNSPNNMPWQGLESVIFALKSIAESVPYDESKYMPKIFSLLAQVPFNESHALLYCTVAEMISAYSDWLFTHNTHLATAFNILFLGVSSSNSHVCLMSTLSLKDITTECQTVLTPFATQIVDSCTQAVLQSNSTLPTNEKSRLMYTIGTTLAISAADVVSSSLKVLTTPLICELCSKAQCDPSVDSTCRSVILDRLTMFSSLIESLYIKQYSGNEYELEGDENDIRSFITSRYDVPTRDIDTTQPSLSLLEQLLPIMAVISTKYRSDEDIMDIISCTLKRSAKSMGVELKPVLRDLLSIVVTAYDPLLNSGILGGSLPLFQLFRIDPSVHKLLRDAFARISEKTLASCIGNPLRQLSPTIENYFRLATHVIKRFPEFIVDSQTDINIEYIYKLAVASLELPEKRTLAEVCSFICLFRQRAIGVGHLHKIFIDQLALVLSNIFKIFGGNFSTPRNAIEHVSDLLFVVIDAEESRLLLKSIVDNENFPTSFVDHNQKANFVSKILHEKNRKKFKDACSEFVMVVRNLNRSA